MSQDVMRLVAVDGEGYRPSHHVYDYRFGGLFFRHKALSQPWSLWHGFWRWATPTF